jgi:Fuc2NAc and GlcNAc transferase
MLRFISLFIYASLACLLSALLVAMVRRYALENSLLDLPNERSSHSVPTPRGGGLAVALVLFTVCFAPLAGVQYEANELIGFLGGAAVVAAIGWLDDHYQIAAWIRLAIQCVAVFWALTWVNGFPLISIGVAQFELGWLGTAGAALAIVWLINLYNFMDGIDGIAATQGCCAATMGAILLLNAGAQFWALTSAVLAGACAGFLIWNWAPARIFLGDVGSYTIGFGLAMLAIMGEKSAGLPALIWVVLLALFIVDASATLLKRILTGQQWYSAHRSHSYQRLVQLGWSHSRVVLVVAAINIVIIWPLAWLAAERLASLLTVLAVTTVIMLGLWACIQGIYERASNENQ